MFTRIHALLATVALASYVSAGVIVERQGVQGYSSNDCNTGEMHCCNDTQDTNTAVWKMIKDAIGAEGGSLTGMIGLNCNPITGAALGGSINCSQQPVCCTGVSFDGLIPVGCNSINVNA